MTLNNSSYMQNMTLPNTVEIKRQMQNGAQIITKPIDKVENIVNTAVDTFTPEIEDEETKKSHKTAIRVGSTVLVLSTLVALLNPKFSSGLINKMKTNSVKAGNKAKIDNTTLRGKLEKFKQESQDNTAKVLQFSNNFNSVKDEGFKWLCKKVKFMKKPHEVITQWFDSISKHTVYTKYTRANKNINNVYKVVEQYKDRLSSSEQQLLNEKLNQVVSSQKFFSKENITARLNNQEKIMSNLENDTINKMKSYAEGFKETGRVKHIKDNLTFWAEDILMPEKEKLQAEGTKAVNNIIGDGKSQKGILNEIAEILEPHMKDEEKNAFNQMLQKSSKSIQKANKSEYIDYFDKKRDLVLGSAPTDILSALIGLTASGIAIGTADSKEERISRTVTGAIPVVAGMGVSLALTAMLFSGIKGMLIGSASSVILSLIGSTANRFIVPKQPKIQTEEVNIA